MVTHGGAGTGPIAPRSHQCPTAPPQGKSRSPPPFLDSRSPPGCIPRAVPASEGRERGCCAVLSLRRRAGSVPAGATASLQTSLTPPKVTLSLLQPGPGTPGGDGALGGHPEPAGGRGASRATGTLAPAGMGDAALGTSQPAAPHAQPGPTQGLSHSQGGPSPCSTLGLCPSCPRSRGSPGAVPLPDPSIMDIVAEPPGARGWQRYYLHLSSFPAPPSFLGRRKSREIRRWKSRLRLLSCSLESGGISKTSLPDPPPGGQPPSPCPCCGPAALRGVLGHVSAGVGRLKGSESVATAGSKEPPPWGAQHPRGPPTATENGMEPPRGTKGRG